MLILDPLLKQLKIENVYFSCFWLREHDGTC